MDIKAQQKIFQIQLEKSQQLRSSIQRLKALAITIIFLTIFLAFGRSATPTQIFISLFPFLLLQVFATRDYFTLSAVSRRIRLLAGGPFFPEKDVQTSWTAAAGVAVKNGFGLLLLLFDCCWLSHAYLYPAPAKSVQQFIIQLSIGPVSGTAFLLFTILLWGFYAWLFLKGLLYENAMLFTTTKNSLLVKNGASEEVWVKIKTYDGSSIYLQGQRHRRDDGQPLILFPGFFQNAFVYDLTMDTSLARFLWQNGFDVWLVHSRGTAESEGRDRKTSLDDLAGDDIPAIISHVYTKTGRKPIFVGHSQGGICAIMSLMGATKQTDGTAVISMDEKARRENSLQGLVTLGSFLDFTFSKRSPIKGFVKEGWQLGKPGKKVTLLRAPWLMKVLKRFNFLGNPVSFRMRFALLNNKMLRLALFPLTLFLNAMAQLRLWSFLFHLPHIAPPLRKQLFYKTQDGTFSRIVEQFYSAMATDRMWSSNTGINYPDYYPNLQVPISVVGMERDALADPVMMKQEMFELFGSEKKFFTVWEDLGHEDHFANAGYFPLVLEAIEKVLVRENTDQKF